MKGEFQVSLLVVAAALSGLFAFCQLSGLAHGAPTVGEVEPNNDQGNATLLPQGQLASGSFAPAPETDFWILEVQAAGLLELDYNFAYEHSEVFVYSTSGARLPWGLVRIDGSLSVLGVVVPAPQNLFVSVGLTDYSVGTTYELEWSFSADFAPIQAPGEHEPNQILEQAEALESGTAASGRSNDTYADLDVWMIEAPSEGWVIVEFEADSMLNFDATNGATQATAQPSFDPANRVFRVGPGTRLFFAIHHGPYYSYLEIVNYTIKATFFTSLSLLWQGKGEFEPNNNESASNFVDRDTLTLGVADVREDPADVFKITAAVGEFVELEVSLTQPGASVADAQVESIGDGVRWRPTSDPAHPMLVATFLMDENATIQFQIRPLSRNVTYEISAKARQTFLFSGPETTIQDLDGDPSLTLLIDPKNQIQPSWNFAPGGIPRFGAHWNLATGSEFLWGETLCAGTFLDRALHGIVVRAGLILAAEDVGLQKMVVSQTSTIDLPVGGRSCIHAMSHNESGAVGAPGSPYHVNGFLTGDAELLMRRIDAAGDDGESGQLALWAVTSATTETRARQWGASDSHIAEARRLLDGAGLQTALNPNPAPLFIASAIGIAAALSVAVILGWARGRSTKRRATHRVPDGTAFQGSAVPIATGPRLNDRAVLGDPPDSFGQAFPSRTSCPRCHSILPIQFVQCPTCGERLRWG